LSLAVKVPSPTLSDALLRFEVTLDLSMTFVPLTVPVTVLFPFQQLPHSTRRISSFSGIRSLSRRRYSRYSSTHFCILFSGAEARYLSIRPSSL
jgi:hypothetical protein